MDADDITDESRIIEVMPKADIVLDDQDRDNTNVTNETGSSAMSVPRDRPGAQLEC